MKIIATIALIITFIPVSFINAAAVYKPLVGIPGVDTTNFDSFISTLYALSISIAGLLAVLKIILAGIKYMTTDIVPSKGAAKEEIKGALIGLVVVLSAVLILTVINPNITNVDLTLSPAIERTNSGSGPAATVTPPTIIDASVYTYIRTQYSSTEQKQLFQKNCTDANYHPEPDGKNMVIRCYKTGVGKAYTREIICGNSNSLACNDQKLIDNAKAKCVSRTDGVFTVDPENIKEGVCIFSK